MQKSKLLLILAAASMIGCQQLPPPKPVAVVEPEAETPCQCPPISCPQPSKPSPPACPVVKPAPVELKPERPDEEDGGLPIIGRVENINIMPQQLKMKGRIDTGAGICSLHAVDIVKFERDGDAWVRFAVAPTKKRPGDAAVAPVYFERPVQRHLSIKQLSGTPQNRPVVEMTLAIGELEEKVEVTLTDRSGYLYPVLIGRNFLRDRALVDVSRKFVTD